MPFMASGIEVPGTPFLIVLNGGAVTAMLELSPQRRAYTTLSIGSMTHRAAILESLLAF